jgi:hypothetical protein
MSQIIRVFLFGAFVFMKLTILGQKQNFTIDTTLVSGQITNLILNRSDFFYSKIGVEINASNPDFSADMRLSTRVKKDSLVFANANYMAFKQRLCISQVHEVFY